MQTHMTCVKMFITFVLLSNRSAAYEQPLVSGVPPSSFTTKCCHDRCGLVVRIVLWESYWQDAFNAPPRWSVMPAVTETKRGRPFSAIQPPPLYRIYRTTHTYTRAAHSHTPARNSRVLAPSDSLSPVNLCNHLIGFVCQLFLHCRYRTIR